MFIYNYLQNQIPKKLNIKIQDLENTKFIFENDNIYYKNNMILSSKEKENDGVIYITYTYYDLKK